MAPVNSKLISVLDPKLFHMENSLAASDKFFNSIQKKIVRREGEERETREIRKRQTVGDDDDEDERDDEGERRGLEAREGR